LCSAESVEEIIDPREWITVFNRNVVESPIIYTEPEAAIFLLGEEYRCSGWGGRRSDESCREVFVDEFA
jgi:hypothetical protein